VPTGRRRTFLPPVEKHIVKRVWVKRIVAEPNRSADPAIEPLALQVEAPTQHAAVSAWR